MTKGRGMAGLWHEVRVAGGMACDVCGRWETIWVVPNLSMSTSSNDFLTILANHSDPVMFTPNLGHLISGPAMRTSSRNSIRNKDAHSTD